MRMIRAEAKERGSGNSVFVSTLPFSLASHILMYANTLCKKNKLSAVEIAGIVRKILSNLKICESSF